MICLDESVVNKHIRFSARNEKSVFPLLKCQTITFLKSFTLQHLMRLVKT